MASRRGILAQTLDNVGPVDRRIGHLERHLTGPEVRHVQHHLIQHIGAPRRIESDGRHRFGDYPGQYLLHNRPVMLNVVLRYLPSRAGG